MSLCSTHVAQRQLSPRKMNDDELRREYVQLMTMQHSLSMEDRRISAQIEALRAESVRFQQTAEVEDECVTNRLMRRLQGEERDVSMCEDTLREEQNSVNEIAQRIRLVREQRVDIEKRIDEQQNYQLHELQTKLVTAANEKNLELELQKERRRYLDVLQRLLQHMRLRRDANPGERDAHVDLLPSPMPAADAASSDNNHSHNNTGDVAAVLDNSSTPAALLDGSTAPTLAASTYVSSSYANPAAANEAVHPTQGASFAVDTSKTCPAGIGNACGVEPDVSDACRSHEDGLCDEPPCCALATCALPYTSDAASQVQLNKNTELSALMATPEDLPLPMTSVDKKVVLAEQRLNKLLQEQMHSVQQSIANEHRCAELASKLDYVQSEVFLKRAKVAKLKEELAQAQKQLEELGSNNLLDSVLSDASFCTTPM